jgi:hypothetical protein
MIKDILLLGSFFLAGIVFMWLRSRLLNKVKNTVKEKITGEKFEVKKLKKIFNLADKVEWIKSIKEIIDARKLVIYSLIIMTIYGYGWYKGKQGKPVKVDIGYGKEALIKLDGHFLHINKEGEVYVEDGEGNKIKQIAVKDIPALQKKLKPYGFEFKPIGVIGAGAGNKSGFEGGAGVSFVKYWQWRLEAFVTNRGIYMGTSYKITDNSGLGLGAGKGYKGDSRAILYYRWEF